MIKIILITLITLPLLSQEYYFYKNKDEKEFLTPINQIFRDNKEISYYKMKNNIIIGVSDKIIVKTDINFNINDLISKFQLKILKKLSKNVYLLQTKDKSLTLDTANRLNENINIKYAHPDFIKQMIRR